ncbi:MAG: hypothetical protein JKY24_00215 [Pseudomonadales bacterium]|nr:hypothetical protein [Pseudomonadales bacterium]
MIASNDKALIITVTFIVSAILTFVVTYSAITSSNVVLSKNEHSVLLKKLSEANSNVIDSDWSAKHHKENLDKARSELNLANANYTNTKSTLREAQHLLFQLSSESQHIKNSSAQCSNVKSDYTKLTCYDRVSRIIAASIDAQIPTVTPLPTTTPPPIDTAADVTIDTTAQVQSPPLPEGNNQSDNQISSSIHAKGAWELTEDRSSSNKLIAISLSTNAQKVTTHAEVRQEPSLNLQCNENNITVFIDWGFELEGDNIKLLTQLDQNAAERNLWDVSKNGHNTMVTQEDSKAFIKTLLAHKRLLVQVENKQHLPVMADFNLADLENNASSLQVACVF